MSVFKRVRGFLRGRTARLRRLKQGALYLMKHVQMTGYCECFVTRDADDQPGYLLIVNTHQIIPVSDRELIQSYFRRKLAEFGETGSLPLLVTLRDGDDLAHAMQQPPALASSARIASIIAAANQGSPEGPPSQLLRQRREDLAAERKHRFEDSGGGDYEPKQEMPMTDLGSLPEAETAEGGGGNGYEPTQEAALLTDPGALPEEPPQDKSADDAPSQDAPGAKETSGLAA